MSRTRGPHRRNRWNSPVTFKGKPYKDGAGKTWRVTGYHINSTKSTSRLLGSSWHSHHNIRKAEMKSKQHVKRNTSKRRRREGKKQIRSESKE